jgi:DNA polymerase IV (family X)
MKYTEAKSIAEKWMRFLTPACERIEIAGSIRRGKAEVNDIDIVLKPLTMTEPDLFGQPTEINFFEELVTQVAHANGATFLLNGPKHKKLALPEGIKLELWIVRPPAEFGAILLIRTGPEDFSHWIVTPRRVGGGLPSYLREKEGALWRYDRKISTPEETDFFKAVGMTYIEPERRRAHWVGAERHG